MTTQDLCRWCQQNFAESDQTCVVCRQAGLGQSGLKRAVVLLIPVILLGLIGLLILTPAWEAVIATPPEANSHIRACAARYQVSPEAIELFGFLVGYCLPGGKIDFREPKQ